MYRKFDFEGDIHVALDCVPLTVRRKLDLAGEKISLAGWQSLPREDRLALCHLPVDAGEDLAVYLEVLRAFAARARVDLSPLAGGASRGADWSPPRVLERLRQRIPEVSGEVTEAWLSALSEEERYAVFKLADARREPEKLWRLLAELGLAGR